MAKKGVKLSEEHKRRIGEAHIGKSSGMLGKKHSEKTKQKIRELMIGENNPFYGKHHSKDFKDKIRKINKGKHYSYENEFKKGDKRIIGENHWNWKGGITSESRRIKTSIEYRLWREAVFARDNWTCQKYKIRGCILHPHHIKNFSDFTELRLAIDNGITLSEKAHKEFHHLYGTKNNTKEQLEEFLNNK